MAELLYTSAGPTARPGVYPRDLKINATSQQLGTNGVLCLVGEADGGPAYSEEADLTSAYFGPDSLGAVQAKYQGDRLVDAFNRACRSSADPAVTGAPQRIYLIKTNQSTKAWSNLLKVGGGTYHTLADRSWGVAGNALGYAVSATAEVVPTTDQFTLLVPNATTGIDVRANGGSAQTLNVNAATLPPAVVSALDGLTGVSATGGANRGVLSVAGTLTLTASGNTLTIVRSQAWEATPSAGDTLYVPSGSAVEGATQHNRGSYVVTSATSTQVVATKLLDAAGAAGALTAPESVTATPVAALTDIACFAPVTVSLEAADPVDGVGKSLEVTALTTGTGRLTDLCYLLSAAKVTWVSTASAPKLLVSGSEYAVRVDVSRQTDHLTESFPSIGGQVALHIGYQGTTATCTVTSTSLSTTVTGGSGSSLSIAFGTPAAPRWRLLRDLAEYINSRPGYTCRVGSAALGNRSPFELDEVVAAGICSDAANTPGRLKIDAWSFWKALQGSSAVQLGTTNVALAQQPTAPTGNRPAPRGLPAAATLTYLANGTRGATTQAGFAAAIDALAALRVNMVVPLISANAATDIELGTTDPSSTYEVEAVNLYALQHCRAFSDARHRRYRQLVASRRGSYLAAKAHAQMLGTELAALAFQDYVDLGIGAAVVQHQPWMAAVAAAAMQLAAFTGGIVQRRPQCLGAAQAAGDWSDGNNDQVDDALRAGLLVLARNDDEQWVWENDQTTWSSDDNFYRNSIQQVYVGHVIQSTTIRRLRVLVGPNVADLNDSAATNVFLTVLRDLRAIRATSPSVGAEEGFRDAVCRVAAGKVTCSAMLYMNEICRWVDVGFTLSQADLG